MSELNRNKFWIAIARCGAFSAEDKNLFRIWPLEYPKNGHVDSFPKFVEGKNLENARQRVHFAIDKIFDDFYRVADMAEPTAVTALPPEKPIDCDSLCIGEQVAAKVEQKQEPQSSDTLLDLKMLL